MIAAFCRWLCRTFPNRARIVPRADDGVTPLLTQFMIIPRVLYLQHFEGPETNDYFHRHRWHYMRSFVLSGFYIEERPGQKFYSRRAGRTHKMDHSTVHRVEYWSSDCWTLFLMLRPGDDWGYYARQGKGDLGRYTPWRDFVKKRVPTIETKQIAP